MGARRKLKPVVGTIAKGNKSPNVQPCLPQSVNIILKKIEALPVFFEFRRRMIAGEGCSPLARELLARGYWPGLSEVAARVRLSRYKKYKLQNAAIIDVYGTKTVKQKAKALGKVIVKAMDELKEYDELYAIQKERITDFRSKERQLPIPFKQIDECMGVAIELISAHSALRLEVGDLVRVPTEVSLSLDAKTSGVVEARYGRESLQRVLADPKKRAKVAGIVEKLLMNTRLQDSALTALDTPEEKLSVVEVVTEESGSEEIDEETEEEDE